MQARSEYQSGEDFQREVRSTLEKMGVDLSSERFFAFYLYLPNQSAAEACARQIETLELDTYTYEAAGESGQWVCYVNGVLIPSPQTLIAIGDLMLKLVEQYQGIFDGWAAPQSISVISTMLTNYRTNTSRAQEILRAMRERFSTKYTYVLVNQDDFDGVDFEFYASLQQQFEALGFVFIADIENRTVRIEEGLKTFTRVMMHPETKATASITHVPPTFFTYIPPDSVNPFTSSKVELRIFDIETCLDDGQYIQSTTTSKVIPYADWPKIHIDHLAPTTTVAELYQSHLAFVSKVQSRSPEAKPIAIDSFDAYVSAIYQKGEYKRDYLAEIGWVTKDYLLTRTKGDVNKAEAIFAETQKLLAMEKAKNELQTPDSLQNLPQVRTEYHPVIGATPTRLWCLRGWNDDTTAAVRKRDFEHLTLISGGAENFTIPHVSSLSYVEHLHLKCSSILLGAENFTGVKTLHIEFVPKNGLDFDCFPQLEDLWFEWEKGLDAAIQNLTELKSIYIDGGKMKDCSYFSKMTKLKELSIIGGSLAALDGLNLHPQLTSLSLGYFRNLTSINEVYELPELRELHFDKLPKVSGVFELARMVSLEKFQSWDTKQTIDLSHLDRLTNLNDIHITDNCANFDIEQLLSLKKLKHISIPAIGGLEDEQTVRRLAEAHGYKIERIQYAGTKKKPHVHLSFDV